jgi:hypothetical protein
VRLAGDPDVLQILRGEVDAEHTASFLRDAETQRRWGVGPRENMRATHGDD